MNYLASILLVIPLLSSSFIHVFDKHTIYADQTSYVQFFPYLSVAPIIPDIPPILSDDWGGLSSFFQDVQILSSIPGDGTNQNARFYKPQDQTTPRPLVVALHTWQTFYDSQFVAPCLQWSIANNWVFISPDFRGNNVVPNAAKATGSEKAVQDILDAVEYAKIYANVDARRIYLVGSSGGGHMALLMAGRHPEIWAGVSAWASITDLTAWYDELEKIPTGHNYREDIKQACGGDPLLTPAADAECLKRSPVWYLSNATAVPLDINAGIHDGHNGNSVPIRHSLNAFNLVASAQDQVSPNDINFMVQNQNIPTALQGSYPDSMYGEKIPLFRRQSRNARITIFDGDHEIIYWAAMTWLAYQYKP